jgi:DNA-binding NarL/FixJ family response regulator
MVQITVFIAEDHALVREGTRQILEQQPDLRVVGEADRGDSAVELIGILRPAVVLLDLRLPVMNGIEVATRIRDSWPDVKVLILSAYDDEDYVLAALEAGVAGYLLKIAPGREVVEAVRAAYAGETVLHPGIARQLARQWQRANLADQGDRLSPRELAVLGLLAHGSSNKEIAAALGISFRTVEGHLGNIFSKLGVDSRIEAVLYAVDHRLLSRDGPAPT